MAIKYENLRILAAEPGALGCVFAEVDEVKTSWFGMEKRTTHTIWKVSRYWKYLSTGEYTRGLMVENLFDVLEAKRAFAKVVAGGSNRV